MCKYWCNNIDTKTRTCYYFDDITNIIDLDLDNVVGFENHMNIFFNFWSCLQNSM